MVREVQVRFNVTEAEKAALENVSHELRMNLSQYLRFVALAPNTATVDGRLSREALTDAFVKAAAEAISYLPGKDAED